MLQTKELRIVELEASRAREIAELNEQLIKDENHSNPMTIDELESRMKGWLQSDYSCIGIEQDGEIVSYALWRDDIDYYYIRQIFTHRNLRRQGLAKRLMIHLESTVLIDKPIRLEVLSGNDSAMNFYKSLEYSLYAHTLQKAI